MKLSETEKLYINEIDKKKVELFQISQREN